MKSQHQTYLLIPSSQRCFISYSFLYFFRLDRIDTHITTHIHRRTYEYTHIHTPYMYRYTYIHTHTHTCTYTCIRLSMPFWGAQYIDTHLLHYRTLRTHIVPSKSAAADPQPYQTTIYVVLTAPSKKTLSYIHTNY